MLSQIIIDHFDVFYGSDNGKVTKLSLLLTLATYGISLVYMVTDIGAITKIANDFPFKSSSRYTNEILIAFFYISLFAFIYKQSYWAIICYGLVLLWGGIWAHILRKEYRQINEHISDYSKTLRILHILFGSIFLLEGGVFVVFYQVKNFEQNTIICFITTYVLWHVIGTIVPIIAHGDLAIDYSVSIFPEKYSKKILEWFDRFAVALLNGKNK